MFRYIQGGNSMKLKSKSFRDGEVMPVKFTCDGDGISPALFWEDVPDGTQSFVLIFDDPDAVSGTYDHWIIYDIPKEIHSIQEGEVLNNAKIAKSSNHQNAYVAPCPPKGSGLHHYTFVLYALDIEYLKPDSLERVEIEKAMKGHIITEAKLIVTYEKKKKFLFF